MILYPAFLARMILHHRRYAGSSEFKFRPWVLAREDMEVVDVRSRKSDFRHTVWLRKGTTDSKVFEQVFFANQYNLRRFTHYKSIMMEYGRLCSPLIIDMGANVGLYSIYARKNFPDARIIALEPDKGNYAMMIRNLANLGIDMVNAAVASVNGKVDISNPGGDAWAYRTTPVSNHGSAPALSVASLLESAPLHQPFIAKIDIEGAEDQLFSRNTEWFDRFPIVFIEVHDWLIPRSASSRNFFKTIASLDRDLLIEGENLVSISNRI